MQFAEASPCWRNSIPYWIVTRKRHIKSALAKSIRIADLRYLVVQHEATAITILCSTEAAFYDLIRNGWCRFCELKVSQTRIQLQRNSRCPELASSRRLCSL